MANATRRRKKRTTKAGGRKRRSAVRGINRDAVKKQQEENDGRSSGQYHDLEQGWNHFFFMPPYSDAGLPWKEVERHGFHVCPKRASNGKKKCSACEELRRRQKKGDDAFISEWRLKSVGYFNALKRSEVKKKDPGCVKALRLSQKSFDEYVEWLDDELETDEGFNPTDPTACYLVSIKKKGSGMQTRYTVKIGDPVDISAYVTDEFLSEALLNLDKIKGTQPADEKELRKAIRAAADEDEDDDFSDDDEDDDFSDDAGDDGDDDFSDDDDDEGDDEEAGDEDDDYADDDEDGEDDDYADDEEAGDEDDGDEEDDLFDEDDDLDDEEEEPPPRRRKKKAPAKKKRPAKKAPAKKAPRRTTKKKTTRRRR